MTKILAFAGSARRDSLNKRLVAAAARAAREAGAEVTEIDLADFPMPLYHGDDEDAHGAPEARGRLMQLVRAHDGFILGCPEYNGSITPLLKNTIDWLSRKADDEQPLEAFAGKTCMLVATSPGALGGIRGLVHVRAILSGIGVHVLPGQLALPKGHEAFDASGALADAGSARRLAHLASELVTITGKLAG
ncbi:MAG: NAD(P)H-dependent oxidoreductase [Planctomycetes bacterium]|nr:NAD(P)H-dependent oxidoreductase [Planctomycetota bacterium]